MVSFGYIHLSFQVLRCDADVMRKGVRQKIAQWSRKAEMNSEGVACESHMFVKILGPKFGLMLLTLKLRFIFNDYVGIRCHVLWLHMYP